MTPAIQCRYTCAACRVNRKAITIAGRGPDESLDSFMTRIGRAIALEHRTAFPRCQETTMTELLIPVTDDPRLGAGARRAQLPG
jgi:hypothetical protein